MPPFINAQILANTCVRSHKIKYQTLDNLATTMPKCHEMSLVQIEQIRFGKNNFCLILFDFFEGKNVLQSINKFCIENKSNHKF